MICHICKAEAVSRCYQCGGLVCEQHVKNDTCARCSSGIREGDPGTEHVSTKPLPRQVEHAWWRPQPAEEYHPPACYECRGLARAVCRHCQSIYCRDHAGPSGLCKACGQSANLGLYVFGGMMAIIVLMYICTRLFS